MKVLKILGIGFGALLLVVVIAIAALALVASVDFKQTQADRPLYPITADTSPQGLTRGKYLVEQAMACTDACHTPEGGSPLSGSVEELALGPAQVVFAVPNLTSDLETGLGAWTDAEIARAIREGVDNEGVELVIMPSYSFKALSDADIAAVVGYLRSLKPVNNQIPPFKANLVAKILYKLGMFGQSSVQAPITAAQATPDKGSLEYGEYLIQIGGCIDCHQPDFAGGPVPQIPGNPVAANLTLGGELSEWSDQDFIRTVKEGIRPSGIPLADYMPRYQTADEDLIAIFHYLQSVPVVVAKQ